MKSLSFKELDLLVDRANLYKQSVLEDVVYHNDILLLLLKKVDQKATSQKVYFIADVRPKPFFIVSEGRVPGYKKQIKPLYLFLKARFLGSVFESAHVQSEYGRLLTLKFSGDREIELHLFSQARNIILKDGAEKKSPKISLHKTIDLKLMGDTYEDPNPRSAEQIESEWLESMNVSSAEKSSATGEDAIAKLLRKKNQGLQDLEKKQKELENSSWPEVAQWLAMNRSLDVPEELSQWIDEKKSVQWNVENAFTKSKQAKEKLASVQERLEDLQKEIAKIQSHPESASISKKGDKDKVNKEKTAITGAQGRTKIINESVRAYIGKSALDNLKILRQSKAWYLWMHVKELPGSHGIIAFNKGEQISQEILREVARWVVEQSLTVKQLEDWRGAKCDVIYCECRFVTPIRGDKLGRVNYKNEKTLTISLN